MSRRKTLLNRNRRKDHGDMDLHFSTHHTLHSERMELTWEATSNDSVMRRKYTLVFINAMFGVFLMIIDLQVSWNGTELIKNNSNEVIRILITISTVFLIAQLIDYYREFFKGIITDWRNKKNLGQRVTTLMVLRSTAIVPLLLSEMLICIVHPPPFISPQGIGSLHMGDAKWGLFMWLRLYMCARILRDYSTIYQKRYNITSCYPAHAPPKFNWVMSFKYFFANNPIIVMSALTSLTIFVCSHWIYVFEREGDSSMFTFPVAMYLSFISLITGWPTDTYDEYNPQTFVGRSACIIACMMGLFLLACIIELIGYRLFPTPYEKPALNWVACYQMRKKVRHAAARVIQIVWRHHRYVLQQQRLGLEEGYSIQVGPSPEERIYTFRFMELVRDLHRARRLANSLDAKLEETQPDRQPLQELAQMVKEQNEMLRDGRRPSGSTTRPRSRSGADMERRIQSVEDMQAIILERLDAICKSVGASVPEPPVKSVPSMSPLSPALSIDSGEVDEQGGVLLHSLGEASPAGMLLDEPGSSEVSPRQKGKASRGKNR